MKILQITQELAIFLKVWRDNVHSLKWLYHEIFDLMLFSTEGKLTIGVVDTRGHTGGHIFLEIYFDCSDIGVQLAMVSRMPA